MRKFLVLPIMVSSFASLNVHAESNHLGVGCAYPKLYCYEDQNNAKKCDWAAGVGFVFEVELRKTGKAPQYEIWEGSFSETTEHKKPFKISIYQRRDSSGSHTFLSANLEIRGINVLARGENTVEASYISEAEGFGEGVHCTIDLQKPTQWSSGLFPI